MAKVLLLNNNETPLHITSWKRALVLLIKGKAQCVKHLENAEDFINVESQYIPRVIKMNYDVAVPDKELPFCRENILIRDDFTCQYCGRKFPISELTLDHVFPKSRKGPEIWENMVACCKECNQYKADRTPKEAGMKLLKRPIRPDDYIDFVLKKYSKKEANYWIQYLKTG